MERLLIIGGLFVLAGLCEIGGGYLVWGWMRDHKPLLWALLGATVLAAYGVVAALQPISDFGRVYAAYGGVSKTLYGVGKHEERGVRCTMTFVQFAILVVLGVL